MSSNSQEASQKQKVYIAHTSFAVAVAAAITVTAFLALLLGRLMHWNGWQEPTTLIASTGFVVVALFGGATRSAFGRFLLAALICCWVGDMVGPHDFLLGAFAFLLAHLFLIPAFLALGPTWRVAALSVVPLGLISLGNTAMLWPRIPPGDRATIAFYTVAISVMVILALSTARRCKLIPIAAVLFYISDYFVARWKYVGGDWNGLVCYPLYYAACLLFALSVYAVGRSGSTP